LPEFVNADNIFQRFDETSLPERRMEKDKLPTVLILCTGNSCRSHIAEGFLRQVAGTHLDVQSAGSKPAGYVHPLAIKVRAEIGIDISKHRSKPLSEFLQQEVET
jgi:arsenate reductase (thioredoxin)